jgi:hypothetical protein
MSRVGGGDRRLSKGDAGKGYGKTDGGQRRGQGRRRAGGMGS